jgi:hypothetical protein
MPEQPSPVLESPAWSQCTCKRCKDRRLAAKLLAGCPCKQCQPGDGIDFDRGAGVRTATRRAEMRLLLKKNDAGTLTPAEEDRLDYLCHDYIYGN